MVGNGFERDAAERVIAGLTGVRGIVDDIEIKILILLRTDGRV